MSYYNMSNSSLAQSVLLLLAKSSLSMCAPFSKRKQKTKTKTKKKNAVDEKSLLLCLFSGYILRKPEIVLLLIQTAHSQIFSLGEHSLLT